MMMIENNPCRESSGCVFVSQEHIVKSDSIINWLNRHLEVVDDSFNESKL
jgi:hypothetical protein